MTPSATAISAATLEPLLKRELLCAEQLLQSIQREHELLSDRDIDNLPTLIAEKNQHIATLQAISQQRESLLTRHGYGAGLQGVQQSFKDLGAPQHLSKLLDQLIDVAEQCQRLNLINGRLVRQHQQQSQNALGILQGQNHLPTDTYTQQGIANTASQSRTLGKA